ncbi:hypothetical protein PIB30_064611 [Stylosanthes scabra]|uniref:Transposase (putative) gypsy type domain-containing protein n=1 Tax=Stylosanthes scabra TaxID=79078 RepID=A0ABU6RM09_9FABA|nr:hypothetical protein [Stylosanthes scabra]
MEGNRLTDENGKPIVPVARDDPYSWVKGEVREIVSLFTDEESVRELGDPSLWVRAGSEVRVQFLPCSVEDRVFHKGEGWEYFYMYTTVLLDLGVRFPFSQFEYGVLSQLKCSPSQIHPNAWAFIRGFEVLMDYVGQEPLLEDFKQMYVRVSSPEDQFPFFVDEFLLEQFLLYWYSEPVQILGMNDVDEESGMVVDFLDQYLCSKKPLFLNMLLKGDDRGLKNFFKMRNERELSTSNVVKSEQGVVVNQPSVKRKSISVKSRRAEEGTSEKGKVINLTSSKCCGEEVSLDKMKMFTENQKKLHGYIGAEDLSSLLPEHYPLPVVDEEPFQSKADFYLIESISDVGRAQFIQVYVARMLCIGRYEKLKARKEAEQKKGEVWSLKREVAQKDKELLELKEDNRILSGKVQSLEKDKTDLESRVVELCGQKKEAEISKENHGYDMLIVGFERARRHAEFLFPEAKFDRLDPVKVVHNGALIDDDEVDAEGGGDHDPEA